MCWPWISFIRSQTHKALAKNEINLQRKCELPAGVENQIAPELHAEPSSQYKATYMRLLPFSMRPAKEVKVPGAVILATVSYLCFSFACIYNTPAFIDDLNEQSCHNNVLY